jgi:hypothetical protein
MPMDLMREANNVFRLDMRGLLRKAELDRCEERLAVELRQPGDVRLLVVLDSLEGWDRRDNWSDLAFYSTLGDRIERIAIVGAERWRDEALMFAAADLRRAPVEFFAGSPGEIGAARAWLTA